MRLPPVLSPLDLPGPELRAAALDGELYAIDGCWSPVDEPETPAHRAASLAAQLPERIIAERRSAAWIWGALLRPPAIHELCADIGARVRTGDGWPAAREVVLGPGDAVPLGGIRVTTPLRTVLDLARVDEEFDAPLAASVLRLGGITAAQCIAAVEARRNLPGKQLALRRLASLSPS